MKTDILENFEEFFKKELFTTKSFHPYFDEAYKKMFEVGGKRFRPLLLLSVVRATNPLLIKQGYYAAAAVEMIHTYSLIHDDLPSMDNADLRRGHPTLHISYDEVSAILVGDALNSDAFLMLTRMPIDSATKIKLVEVLSKNAGSGGMVLGQAIDCYFEDKRLSEEELSFLHTNKTGKLIAASLQMGAIVANLDTKIEQKLYDFGLSLGLLFQINDDIIDATKTSQEAGKPTNNDVHKNSYVNLLGLDEAQGLKERMKQNLNEQTTLFGKELEVELRNIITNKMQ